MGTLEKILNMVKKNKKTELYAEMKLDDGRVIATEDEQFMIGSKVFAIGDDGEATALEAGSYTMDNGNKLTIGEDSEILDLGEEAESVEEEASEEVEASEEKELAEDDEADVGDWAGMEKRIKNLEDAVADLKADKEEASAELSEETTEEGKEELSKETEKPIELSADLANEIITRMEELESKIVDLSKEPADEGLKYSPEGSNVNSTIDLKNLSISERTAYYINNK
jgi:hypothetical protein